MVRMSKLQRVMTKNKRDARKMKRPIKRVKTTKKMRNKWIKRFILR